MASFIVFVMAKKAARKPQKPVQVVSSRVVYRGPVFYVTSDQVQEPGGIQVRRDVVRHPGSVVIMAVDGSGAQTRVLLARQYRYAAGGPMWEFPAGRVDEHESELAAAKRELLEETGFTATEWKRVLRFYSSPGFLDETMAVYLARGLTRGAAQPEEDEVIAKRFFPLAAAAKLISSGKLRDGKTIAGLLWLDRAWAAGKPLP
jgi:ADP-ribose pyrophosphatase